MPPAVPTPPTPPIQDLHEWVSFDDPDDQRTWSFDLTFMTSNYTCIFGRGCKGVLTEDTTEASQGCCSYGAHMNGREDIANLKTHAARLTAEQWQFKPSARPDGKEVKLTKKNEDGVHVTKLVDDACIFLNRPGFPGGAGCALHRAALEAGERPLDWKPEVCWQVPLRREDTTDANGHVTSTLREWKRRDWGEGGAEFHWWCTDSPDAFVEKRQVWQTCKDEIVEMTSTYAYDMLAAHITDRRKAKVAFLPHPAVRRPR